MTVIYTMVNALGNLIWLVALNASNFLLRLEYNEQELKD